MTPASTNNLETSPIRRMFSMRSVSEKVRPLFSPKRTLSPSNKYVCLLNSLSFNSTALAIVDFPEPLKPVNQITLLFDF